MATELPIEVGQLGNFESRMLRNFRTAIDDWEEVCSALGRWEAEHLAGDDSEGSRRIHQKWVKELLSWGELVWQTIGHPSFPDAALRRRVEQRMRHLQDKMVLWHGEMSSEEEESILRRAFA